MNFKKRLISGFMLVTLVSSTFVTSVTAAYNPSNAVAYARKHAQTGTYNTDYNSHGSDCTNFVSQCVLAGGISEKVNPNAKSGKVNDETNYWYSDKYKVTIKLPIIGTIKTYYEWAESTTWVRVSNLGSGSGFYQYMKDKESVPVADYYHKTQLDALISAAKVGDVIQIRKANDETKFHSMFVTDKYTRSDGKTDLKLSYHTSDRLDYPFRKDVHENGFASYDPTYTLIQFTKK